MSHSISFCLCPTLFVLTCPTTDYLLSYLYIFTQLSYLQSWSYLCPSCPKNDHPCHCLVRSSYFPYLTRLQPIVFIIVYFITNIIFTALVLVLSYQVVLFSVLFALVPFYFRRFNYVNDICVVYLSRSTKALLILHGFDLS